MLAQNFKTPADLGISDQEFSAFLTVLGMLERNDLVYSSQMEMKPIENGFFMGTWEDKKECGTTRCIGGWVAHLIGQSPYDYVNRHSDVTTALGSLFWSGMATYATVEQAAIGLRNFLTHGEPRWAEAFTAS